MAERVRWATMLGLRRTLLTLALPVLLAGCGGADEGGAASPALPGPVAGTPAPDFLLQDVNPNSATALTMVSPRQHLTRISAWYFGHST